MLTRQFIIKATSKGYEAVGEIREKAGPAPQGWLACNGRAYPIKQFPDLYAVIGDTYQRPAVTPSDHFRVPDMRGRVNAAPQYIEPDYSTGYEDGFEGKPMKLNYSEYVMGWEDGYEDARRSDDQI